MKLKGTTNSKPVIGTRMYDFDLKAILWYCENKLPIYGVKGAYGAVYVYDREQIGIDDEVLSTGLILVDLDHLTKETAELIFNNFEKLVEVFPCLAAIQFSSSYYTDSKKNGLHIYIKSKIMDKFEYKYYATLCLFAIAQIIENLFGIDLRKENENENVLDTHNTSIAQRFNLYYSDYKYNEDAYDLGTEVVFKTKDIEKLQKKYKFKLREEKAENIKVIRPISGAMNEGVVKEKLKIDRNFKIGEYSGNDIRYRISIIADKLFGDKAKDFCDKYFYHDEGSIYTHYSNANRINNLIFQWLKDNDYIGEKKIKKVKEWVSEYHGEIISNIKKYKKLEVIAPTGSGKTTYINETLAKEMNAVVIVPFNVTNGLYDKLTEVNSTFKKEIPKNKPIVMIWDQAVKYWEQIKDRLIIVDEAHQLFIDRSYRDAAIHLVMKLKQENVHVCFMTATPAGEYKWVEHKLEYFKDRNSIKFNAKCVTNVDWAEYHYIKSAIDNNWYDRIVLFDDMNAAKVYEKLVTEGYGAQIAYIRADKKNTEDFIYLRKKELLNKKITICTCVAFNGLNFNNENENILVVGSIQLGQTTSCQIIQQIGRIRDSKVNAKFFFNENIYSTDIAENIKRANEHTSVLLNGCGEIFVDEKWLNPNYVESAYEIDDYLKVHSNIDSIMTELSQTGYINGTINMNVQKDEGRFKMTRAIKKQQSDIMKSDIINGEYYEKNYVGEYDSYWSEQINRIVSNDDFDGLDFDFIQKYVNVVAKQKIVETIIKDIYDIIKAVMYTDKEIEELQNRKSEWMNMLSDINDKHNLSKRIDNIVECRDKYKNKIHVDSNRLYFGDIVFDIIAEEEARMNAEKEAKRIAGSKGKPNKKCEITELFKNPSKYNLEFGQVFDSSLSLSSYTNTNNMTVSRWKKKGWVK